jgi:hypothetical protein
MSTITVEISGSAAEKLCRLVESERRSEAEIIADALNSYTPRKRPLPKGAGKYRSGHTDTSQRVDQILSDAVKEGLWP